MENAQVGEKLCGGVCHLSHVFRGLSGVFVRKGRSSAVFDGTRLAHLNADTAGIVRQSLRASANVVALLRLTLCLHHGRSLNYKTRLNESVNGCSRVLRIEVLLEHGSLRLRATNRVENQAGHFDIGQIPVFVVSAPLNLMFVSHQMPPFIFYYYYTIKIFLWQQKAVRENLTPLLFRNYSPCSRTNSLPWPIALVAYFHFVTFVGSLPVLCQYKSFT